VVNFKSGCNLNFNFSFPLQNWNPDNYQNQGNRSIILSMKPNTSLVHAVEQLAHILEKEQTKTLIKVAYDKEQIEDALKKSCVKSRVSLNLIFLVGHRWRMN
jgi:hypothetical protein